MLEAGVPLIVVKNFLGHVSLQTTQIFAPVLYRYSRFTIYDNEALFVTTRKPYNRLTVAGLEHILKDLGKSAGVEKCHPHRFRRTMATNVLRKGTPLEEVKELLGHTKLDTTMIYCTINKDNV
ncbi:MAG: tyrosine-type recombinase/integrase, partial [Lachnospiraceae bacterium]|nr:tyrosine-type recombinase/integrase [Lachnospiraceae bacterium]